MMAETAGLSNDAAIVFVFSASWVSLTRPKAAQGTFRTRSKILVAVSAVWTSSLRSVRSRTPFALPLEASTHAKRPNTSAFSKHQLRVAGCLRSLSCGLLRSGELTEGMGLRATDPAS